MAKLSKTARVRRALKKNPDANARELAEKIGIHSSAVYTTRKKMAAENGEAPKKRGRPRRLAAVAEPVTFKATDRPTAATVTVSSDTNMQIAPPERRRTSLVAQVAMLEGMGVDRVRAILAIMDS